MSRTRFTIITTQKSGAGVISLGLDKRAEIVCHDEVFSTQGIYLSYDWNYIPRWNITQRNLNVGIFSQYIFTYPFADTVTCIGYVMTQQSTLAAAANWTKQDNTTKKILFERKDKLRVYLGQLIFENLNPWQMPRGADYSLPNKQFTIDIEDMLTAFQADEDYYTNLKTALSAAGLTYLHIKYEDFVSNTTGTATKASVLNYLGISTGTIETVFPPYQEVPLDYTIINYDAVAAAITSSKWASQIDLGTGGVGHG